MGQVDFRAARHHEPPRAKRKCRVVLRNSRSRSSSHSENDAEYMMGLRKSGASREYNSIDTRFSETMNQMALAMRQQRIRKKSVVEEDDDIKALTERMAGGLRLARTGTEETLAAPIAALPTIVESTEAVEEGSSATDYILDEYLSASDLETEVADDKESLAGDTQTPDAVYRFAKDTRSPTPSAASEIQFVGYATPKWAPQTPTFTQTDSLAPMSSARDTNLASPSRPNTLPSLSDIGVMQYLSPSLGSSSRPPSPPSISPEYPDNGVAGDFSRSPKFGHPSFPESKYLPRPQQYKPVYYPHKPVHYAPYGTV